jgi:nitrite reductase (NO-forming)
VTAIPPIDGGGRALNVIETEPPRRGPDRRVDRQITYAGLMVAMGFLIAALASLAVPPAARLGSWLPLHLVLAGAVGTAIAAMVPFFLAALSVAPPAHAWLRIGSLVLVAGGATAGVVGRLPAAVDAEGLAAAGAVAYVGGIAAVGLAALLPLRRASGTRRPLTELAYLVALLDVIAGVSLVAMFLAGDAGVTGHWASLKVAHGWLNVLGFVTLVVAGTLVHFAPTVLGARIRRRRSGVTAVLLLAAAAPVVAIGYAAGPDGAAGMLVRLGAVAAVAGAGALVLHGLQARRDRAGWTTDLDWHRFTGGSLLIAPAWLLVGSVIAAAGILEHGADPRGWRLERIEAPLVLGFVLQVLLGSMAHLLPAIGPGTPEAHAAQRRSLGRGASARLGAWNAGVAVLTFGLVVGHEALARAGLGLALAAGAATLLLLLLALRTR